MIEKYIVYKLERERKRGAKKFNRSSRMDYKNRYILFSNESIKEKEINMCTNKINVYLFN